MKIEYGKKKSEWGPGVSITLEGHEIARAIDACIVAHGVHVNGPRTIRVNSEHIENGSIFIDPSGFVIDNGKKYSGRGEDENT